MRGTRKILIENTRERRETWGVRGKGCIDKWCKRREEKREGKKKDDNDLESS